MDTLLTSTHPFSELNYINATVKHFGAALTHGTKFIYQAMPRMLTLWLEFGEIPRVLELYRQKQKEG